MKKTISLLLLIAFYCPILYAQNNRPMYVPFSIKGKWGMMDTTGKEIIPFLYIQ